MSTATAGVCFSRVNEVDQTGALRAQRSAVERMIRITFDVDDAGGGVFRAVTEAVHEDAAADRAVRTGIA